MRWLKALVVVLAVLIGLATGLLGYGFIKRSEDPNWRLFNTAEIHNPSKVGAKSTPPTNLAPSSISPWNIAKWKDLKLGLAPECRISQISAEGNRLILSIEPAGSCRRIMIIDMDVGQVQGTVLPRQ